MELRGVGRRYDDGTVALAGVDLAITPGESIAVVGRSGSGKSTMLNVLGLLDVPTSGEILIRGERISSAGDRVRSAHRASMLGFVFQRSHLVPALTVRENVELGAVYAPSPGGAGTCSVDEALAAVGMTRQAGSRARTLSGGEMQRVAIARTLVRPAPLWLADEPTGNLDSGQSAEIIDLLTRAARERGAALVVVTHDREVAARLGRTVTLHDGTLREDTPPAATTGSAAPAVPQPPRAPRARGAGPLAVVRRTLVAVLQGVRSGGWRTRSGIAASALAVALALAALGTAQSARAQVTTLFDAQRATHVTAELTRVDPLETRFPVSVAQLSTFPGTESAELWRYHPGVEIRNGDVALDTAEVILVSTPPGAASASTIRWAARHVGRLQDGQIVLGAALALRLGVTQVDLRPEVVVQGRSYEVVGVLESSRVGTAAGGAFVSDLGGLPVGPDPYGRILVQTAPGAARAVADRLQDLTDPHRTMQMAVGPVVVADSYRGELESSITLALSLLAGVVGLAGLGSVVLVSLLGVTGRTAELGVRRAFGARRSEIVALVLGECGVIGLAGAVVGLALGFTSIMVVTSAARWQPVFDGSLLVVPVLGALVFGLLGGVVPAVAAGRVEPADAVRG